MELLLVACEIQPLLRVNLRQFELGMLLYGLALSSLLLFLARKTFLALSVTYVFLVQIRHHTLSKGISIKCVKCVTEV